MHYKLLRM